VRPRDPCRDTGHYRDISGTCPVAGGDNRDDTGHGSIDRVPCPGTLRRKPGHRAAGPPPTPRALRQRGARGPGWAVGHRPARVRPLYLIDRSQPMTRTAPPPRQSKNTNPMPSIKPSRAERRPKRQWARAKGAAK
jgi:hypothetical protein